ncbi:MAG: hypothetical protein J0M16_03270 [Gammaproteobacteria bacterium]|nr:hypothetical protein [Gammaproteobacteria bacterium]
MNNHFKQLTALSALALLGTGAAQASVIGGGVAGGSEAVATFVNATGDSISLDLGKQLGAIVAGDSFALTTSITSFIAAAGGAGNVSYGILAGEISPRTYLTSAASETFDTDVQLANSAKGLWSSSVNGLVQNLNQGDSTPTTDNLAYGPFLAGSGSPNYIDGGHDNWQSGDFAFSNLVAGNATGYLYKVVFSSANLGFAPITSLGLKFDLGASAIGVASTTVVPAPPAVWLLGTALVPFARRAWRQSKAN